MQCGSSKQDGHVQEDADPHDPTKLSCSKKTAAAPAVRKRKSKMRILVQLMIILMLGVLVVPITEVSSTKNNSGTGIKPKQIHSNCLRKTKATRKTSALMDLSSMRMTIQRIQLALSAHPVGIKSELTERSVACHMNNLSCSE
jgi:hypothetical protein